MKLLSNLTIKLKLIIIILCVTLISISLSSVYEITSTLRFLKSEIIENQQINAKLIAENCATTLIFNDASGAESVLQTLKTIPDISSARIYDLDEVVFAGYVGEGKEFIEDRLPQAESLKTHQTHIIINEEIAFDGVKYGTLCVVVTTQKLHEKIYEYLFTIGISILLIIVLAFVLASLFQKIISRPILKLANFAEKISETKDYKLRVEKTTNDETGILYDRFNSMIGTIDERQTQRDIAEKELMLERENLEERVKQRTVELEAAKIKAEESDQLKSAFLANLSHEIRTPMNGMIGFAEFLKNPNITPEERDNFVDVINSSGEQLLSIINDIVEISKIETNLITIHEGPVDIEQLINDLFKELGISQLRNEAVDFKLAKSNFEIPKEISTDKTKLKQVLTNLITNAFKNTESGSVEFGFKSIDKFFIEFFVRDTGAGIDKSFHKIIFERFRQVKDENKKLQSGSGLGLAISKAYIELMGGAIELESESGKGATFSFRIPLKVLKLKQAKPIKIPQTVSNDLENEIILIAEDDDTNFMLLQIMFSGKVKEIIRAFNGKEAVDICLANNTISVVLMDITMPVMNGLDATQLIKKSRPELPIIATTAHALSGDKEMALNAGCDRYISKPINKDKLFNLIEEVKSI